MPISPPSTSLADNRSDADLVQAVRTGQASAFDHIIHRHMGLVWSIAYARLGRRDAADDLAQEVFLMAFLRLDQLADPKRLAAWLSQITHHRVIDWLRQKQRSSKLVAMVPVESFQTQSAPVAAPDHSTLAAEQTDLLHQALFQLPQDERELILLHFSQGLSQSEIARQLEVHPATVGRQLQKTLARLHQLLQDRFDSSLHTLQPASTVALRATAVVAAVSILSTPAKASLIAAAGTVPVLSSTVVGSASAGAAATGVLAMASAKTLGIVSAIALATVLTGAAVYVSLPDAKPPAGSAPSVNSNVAIGPASEEELAVLRQVRDDCFAPQVQTAFEDWHLEIARKLDPDGRLKVYAQCNGIDHTSRPWLGNFHSAKAPADKTLDLGGTSCTAPSAIFATTGQYYPVTRRKPSRPNHPMQVTAAVTDDWPADETRHFVYITFWNANQPPLKPNAEGLYPLKLYNLLGNRAIQQLVFFAPPGWSVHSSSVPAAATFQAGPTTIHIWQKVLKDGKDDFQVNLLLKKDDAAMTTPAADSPRAWMQEFGIDPDSYDTDKQVCCVVKSEISPTGLLQAKLAVLFRNPAGQTLHAFPMTEMTMMRITRYLTAEGRDIPFHLEQTGPIVNRYMLQFPQPLEPDQNCLLGAIEETDGMVTRQPDGSFQFQIKIDQKSPLPIHRLGYIRLPQGAVLLETDGTFTQRQSPDGRIEIYVDKIYAPEGTVTQSFRYRLE